VSYYLILSFEETTQVICKREVSGLTPVLFSDRTKVDIGHLSPITDIIKEPG
jgi:hypothetical protein